MDPSKIMPNSLEDDFCYGTNVKQASQGIRLGFLRKVYAILSIQLLVTTIACAVFIKVEALKNFAQGSQAMVFLTMIMAIGFIIALHIKRHQYPANMYLLAGFTLTESYAVATVVTFYRVEIVLQALALTLSVFGALTIYTMQSKKDYSTWGAGLFAGLWILIGAGLLATFVQNDSFELVCASGGSLLFCFFIIYDTNMIMKRLSPEEYILAAINLYLDVINLFLETLRILNQINRK